MIACIKLPLERHFSVTTSREQMSAHSEVGGADSEGGEEALRLTRGLESSHHTLAQSRRLVGILSAIILSFVLAMLDTRQQLSLRRALAPELIGDDYPRRILQSF